MPPGILREPDETLEASQILEEFHGQDSALSYLLWSALRDVTLWASVDPDRRAGLYGDGTTEKRLEAIRTAAPDPELEVSLTTLAAVVDVPATASPEMVSQACVEVSRWAVARGAMGTAMAYAQAASLAAPDSAAPAGYAGTVALRWGRLARAETWARRAIGLGRRARQWDVYARAYVDLGEIYALRGSTAAAQQYYFKAAHAGRRHGLRAIRATALHRLLRIALDACRWAEAENFLRAAVRGFERGDPRLGDVLHDAARLWVCIGRYSRALTLLRQLLVVRTAPGDRALTLALQARAAAGVGDLRVYQEAWSTAWSIIGRTTAPEEHLRALLELGRASLHLRDFPRIAQVTRLHASLPTPTQLTDWPIAHQIADFAAQARRPQQTQKITEENMEPEKAPPSDTPHRSDDARRRGMSRRWPDYPYGG